MQLDGGWWTTRELRELEQQALDTARERSDERVGVASVAAREAGVEAAAERHGHALTEEQKHALETITGEGGVVVLVGEAGTGKGVVLDAAREAWERDGQRVIGTAVAGADSTALGAEAGIGETMTTDSLIGRVEHNRLRLDRNTVVVMDEAGMADTRRLARLVEITDRSDSKLVLAGDQAQLSPIGAGGLFGENSKTTSRPRSCRRFIAPITIGSATHGASCARATRNARSPSTRPAVVCTSRRPAPTLVSGWSTTGRQPGPLTRTTGS